jgi:transposase InsO family protein
MAEWTIPQTGNQLEKHLGFLNFFRDIIPNYAQITAPLDKLRKEPDLSTLWLDKHTAIYSQLRAILSSDIVLSFPNFQEPFFVGTDASNHGLGAVLYQKYDDKTHYISFASRSLSVGEKGNGYGAPERELEAVIFALEKFRYYIYGTRFTLLTDHKALTYIFTQKQTNPALKRRLGILLDYDFNVIHLPGILNILPDRLSRLYDADPSQQELEYTVWSAEAVPIELMDPSIQDPVPEDQRTLSLNRAHLMGHFGANAMVKALLNDGKSWPSMRKDAQELVSQCTECQRWNIGKHGFHPINPIHALIPWDHVALDLKEMPRSTSGNIYYLLIVDIATRFIFLRPLSSKSAHSIAKELFSVFCIMGLPKIMQSDNGTEFVNKIIMAMTSTCHVDHRLISAYHPRANGAVERFVQTSSQTIYKRMEARKDHWDKFIDETQLFMNNKVSALHGSSPYSLMFGRRLNGFQDYSQTPLLEFNQQNWEKCLEYMTSLVYPSVARKVQDSQQHQKEIYDFKNHIIPDDKYPPGAQVMILDKLRAQKSDPRYTGPFTIIRRNRGGSYVMTGPDKTEYTFPPSVIKLISQNPITPDHQSAVVDKILDHRKLGSNQYEYLVKWKKLPASLNQWVLYKNFDELTPIHQYWKDYNAKKREVPESSDQVPKKIKLTLRSRA